VRIVIKWRTFKRYLRGKVMQACMCFCARVCVSVRMHAVARLRVLACACVRVRVWLYGCMVLCVCFLGVAGKTGSVSISVPTHTVELQDKSLC
jgi:hypothetical protein